MRARVAVAALLLLAAALPALAQDCKWNGHDFSSLGSKDLEGNDGSGIYNYFVRPCGALTSQPACTAISAKSSTCQVQVTPAAAYDTGDWGTQQWGFIDGQPSKGVMYTLTGSPKCWNQGVFISYTANVMFACGAASSNPVQVNTLGCTQNFTIPTPLACPGGGGGGSGGKHGLSGGWVFIIILCVVFPLYVLVGCVYKSQKLGATGMDKCPNVEFWRDLPALVKDGCAFTFRKIRGLCGGAQQASSYESM